MKVGYNVIDTKTQKVVLTGETKHCFTDKSLKPISLKKYNPEFNSKFLDILEKQNYKNINLANNYNMCCYYINCESFMKLALKH